MSRTIGLFADVITEKDKNNILFHLYNFNSNILNFKGVPMSLRSLSSAAGLSEKMVKHVCELLAEEGYITRIPFLSGDFYKITNLGISYVEKMPTRSRGQISATSR